MTFYKFQVFAIKDTKVIHSTFIEDKIAHYSTEHNSIEAFKKSDTLVYFLPLVLEGMVY